MAIVRPKKKKLGDVLTDSFLSTLLIVLTIVCIYPFWHVLMYSLSDSRASMSGGLFLLPKEFTLEAYRVTFKTKKLFVAIGNSVLKTVVGTAVALVLTSLMAYPLSREELRGRRIVLFYVYFTMLFSGGIIPTYLIVKDVGLLDSFWAYIIPSAMSAYHMFILRNFFASTPKSLPESAMLDGANPMQILWHIMLPLAKPAYATITLYTVQSCWNSYMDGVLYITSSKLEILQVYLRRMIAASGALVEMAGFNTENTISEETAKMTVIAISAIPVTLVYLFLQKYFQKGLNVGAVKG